ncbi:hypothetical protein VTK26DRAFT_7614 [Humicola hyalothermophila]
MPQHLETSLQHRVNPKRRPPLRPHRHGPHSGPSCRREKVPITGIKGPRTLGHPVAQRRKQACQVQTPYTSAYNQGDAVSTGI